MHVSAFGQAQRSAYSAPYTSIPPVSDEHLGALRAADLLQCDQGLDVLAEHLDAAAAPSLGAALRAGVSRLDLDVAAQLSAPTRYDAYTLERS